MIVKKNKDSRDTTWRKIKLTYKHLNIYQMSLAPNQNIGHKLTIVHLQLVLHVT